MSMLRLFEQVAQQEGWKASKPVIPCSGWPFSAWLVCFVLLVALVVTWWWK